MSPCAGLKKASRNVTPWSTTPCRSTSTVPCCVELLREPFREPLPRPRLPAVQRRRAVAHRSACVALDKREKFRQVQSALCVEVSRGVADLDGPVPATI